MRSKVLYAPNWYYKNSFETNQFIHAPFQKDSTAMRAKEAMISALDDYVNDFLPLTGWAMPTAQRRAIDPVRYPGMPSLVKWIKD